MTDSNVMIREKGRDRKEGINQLKLLSQLGTNEVQLNEKEAKETKYIKN